MGSAIVDRLNNEGHFVKSISRKRNEFLTVEQLTGDVSVPESYESQISKWKPEVVVHCAWVTDKLSYRSNPVNQKFAEDTAKLASHCFQSGTRHFVGLGSSAEYGAPKEACNASSTPCHPLDLYGEQKLKAYEYVKSAAEIYGGRHSWARVFQPYGQNQDPSRLIPTAARNFASGGFFQVDQPEVVLDWISSRDVASAISFTLNAELPPLLDIGTSIGTSVGEVLSKVANLLGQKAEYSLDSSEELRLEPAFRLVVSQNSPLLANGWKPDDDLQSGLTWALLE